MDRIDQPQTGHYKGRLIRGGPFVPARIWTDEAGALCCEINGRQTEVYDSWPYLAGHPITIEAWRRMEHRRLWAEANQPWHWAANPTRPLTVDDYMQGAEND